MRNKVAKKLRRKAEAETIGQHKRVTRKLYKQKKREYKSK